MSFGTHSNTIAAVCPKIAVARILGGGNRKRIQILSELAALYLFEDGFGYPGMGNDKGHVEPGCAGSYSRSLLFVGALA